MPTSYPLYTPTGRRCKDARADRRRCGSPRRRRGARVRRLRGQHDPAAVPALRARARRRRARLPPQTAPTIGDRLSAKGVDWAWYSGGWSNANGDVGAPGWTNGTRPGTCTDPNTAAGAVYPNCPDKLFQYHHQPLNYFAIVRARARAARARAPARRGRSSRRSRSGSKQHCRLKPVSFIKPIGAENEHPGYASEHTRQRPPRRPAQGDRGQRAAPRTRWSIVTYDEFGGQWDHVPPPGQGGDARRRTTTWGPGTRIPALVLAPGLRGDFVVDHASARHDVDPGDDRAPLRPALGVRPRRRVQDLSTVFNR